MPVITISRQYGSLGDEIAQEVAQRLDLRLVDQTIIAEVAQRLGFPAGAAAERDERGKRLVSDLVRTMRLLYPATISPQPSTPSGEEEDVDEASYLHVIRQVIQEVARGNNAVIIGRGSTFILGRHPDILHVLLVAPLQVRVERVMGAEGLDQHQAQQRVREIDENRGRYVRRFYHTNWLDLTHYDLVVDTGHFTQPRAADLICMAVAPEKTL